MILVTGPTGSGKSTSLYTMLNHLNRPETNIITLEDPVENQIHGMNQISVDPHYGMGFAQGLKYILRQDPNIVMVGEVRDGETAEIAVQAALTGHLLLSTLHTNNAASAPTRLGDLGVQPFLVASSLIGVVAQRLLRRICPACRTVCPPEPELLAEFGPAAEPLVGAQLFHGVGCDQCFGTGYRGRCGVFELMPISPQVGEAIERRASSAEIQERAAREGMATLLEAGIAKVLAGETTLDEVREHVLVWEHSEETAPVAS
jgi:type II secretory ATPase GspE/PulE/Tfp pilus assembly ATPase PilB-like protein